MAIVQNPITGRTKKKFGTAVFSKQFGKNTMRTRPIEVKNPKTLLQRQQRSKFSLMVELSRMIMVFLRIGFKQGAIGMSQFNVFMKANLSVVITGTFPNFSIDFTKLIVSKGTLASAENPSAVAATGNKVNLHWLDNSGSGNALGTDVVLALIINYTKKTIMQDLISAMRGDEGLEFTVPAAWIGDQVHVYLSFMTPSGDKVTDSAFLGSVAIIA